jgi:hypothetical protein
MAKRTNSLKTKGGRIDWDLAENLLPIHVAVREYPFHAKVLAKKYNMSTSAIYYRLRQHGVSLTDLRNGVAGLGKEVLDRYTIKKVDVKLLDSMQDLHNNTYNKDGAKSKNVRKAKKKKKQ